MLKSLHSADLHLNQGWLRTASKLWSTIVAVALVDFPHQVSFHKHTLLIQPYLCEKKHPKAQHYILRDGKVFENKLMKGE